MIHLFLLLFDYINVAPNGGKHLIDFPMQRAKDYA